MLKVVLLASSVFCLMAHAGLVSLFASSPFPAGTQIPGACVTTCSGPMDTVTQCGPTPQPSCICSVDFQQNLFKCYACIGQTLMETNFTTVQQIIDTLTSECDSAGISLPNLTFIPQSSTDTPTAPGVTQTVPTSLPPATTTPSTQTAGSNAAMKGQLLSGGALTTWALGIIFIAAIYDIGISV